MLKPSDLPLQKPSDCGGKTVQAADPDEALLEDSPDIRKILLQSGIDAEDMYAPHAEFVNLLRAVRDSGGARIGLFLPAAFQLHHIIRLFIRKENEDAVLRLALLHLPRDSAERETIAVRPGRKVAKDFFISLALFIIPKEVEFRL